MLNCTAASRDSSTPLRCARNDHLCVLAKAAVLMKFSQYFGTSGSIFLRPRIDSAFEREDILKTPLLKQLHRTLTADTAVAMNNNFSSASLNSPVRSVISPSGISLAPSIRAISASCASRTSIKAKRFSCVHLSLQFVNRYRANALTVLGVLGTAIPQKFS